ncbi:MAG TPA: protein translocase subunit SecD [Actinomycetota bacterium]|nr:protein translocase subunit SecD [Actinomycetota bacterium]
MKTGRLYLSILFIGVLVLASVGGLLTTVRPVLGLDLVGGVSVVLAGPPGTDKDVMERALERIRDRVDALGVAEPDITLVGNNIQVQLPGLGGQGHVVKRGAQFCAVSSSGKDLGCFKGQAQAQAKARAQSVARVLQLIGTTARLEQRQVQQIIPASDPTYKTTPLTKYDPPATDKAELVTYQDDNGDGRFTNNVDPKYKLGPVKLTGGALSKANAVFIAPGTQGLSANTQPGWRVTFTLNKEGRTQFANITTQLSQLPEGDPKRQLAIVLDGVIESAPNIQEPITGGSGEITGNFTEAEAKNLAVVLNSGALPVQLTKQEVLTVSPTLGQASLRQGLLAGVVGLILLMLYLAFYYRLLGLVTWFGMAIWALLAIGLVSLLGQTVGYALTLAGVAGLVVSIGVTADSYIVFYERLKDEVRHGKTLRSAVMPAFQRSWRTIVAADIVTATAAAVLYVLAVGSVKGFALTLGLSTLLDLLVVYFFKRPVVFLISRNTALSNLRGFGLRSGVAADPAPVAGGER